MIEATVDPHVTWEIEWRTAWDESLRHGADSDEAGLQAVGARCATILIKIMGTPVRTPQGAAVQLRIAMEEQLDLDRWLPFLPAQLEAMIYTA